MSSSQSSSFNKFYQNVQLCAERFSPKYDCCSSASTPGPTSAINCLSRGFPRQTRDNAKFDTAYLMYCFTGCEILFIASTRLPTVSQAIVHVVELLYVQAACCSAVSEAAPAEVAQLCAGKVACLLVTNKSAGSSDHLHT